MKKYNHTTMGTAGGAHLDLTDPQATSIYPSDIAHALARIFRFTGHTDITVAEHSVQVMWALYAQPGFLPMLLEAGITAREALLIALLHDAHEAYTGDISRPMNNAIVEIAKDNPVSTIKRRVQRVIHDRFNLPNTEEASFRRVMNAVALGDRKLLEADRWRGRIDPPWTTEQAERRFNNYLDKLLSNEKCSFVGQFTEWPDNEMGDAS